MIKTLFPYICIILLLITKTATAAQKLIYFGNHENTFVTSLEMDSLGRLWVGTESGVVWYDGQSFHHPGRYELIHDAYIRNLKVLNRDSLLIISNDRIYLIARLQSNPTVYDNFDWSRDAFLTDVVHTDNRFLLNNWKDSSIYIVNAKLQFIKSMKFDFLPLSIACHNNRMFIGDDNSTVHIFRFEKDSLIFIKQIRYDPRNKIDTYSLYADQEHILVAPIQRGIIRIQSYMSNHPKLTTIRGTEEKTLIKIRRDPLHPNRYWAGSQYFGIFYFDDSHVIANEEFSSELTNLLVWDLFPSPTGRIFVGTQYGITIFQNTSITQFFPSEIGAGNFIWGIERITPNRFWIATGKGVVELVKKGNSFRLFPIPFLKSLSDQSIFKIIYHNQKKYLLTSEFPYFMVVKGKKYKKLRVLDISEGISITDFKIDARNRIWFASSKIIYLDLNTGKIKKLPFPGNKKMETYSIEQLPNGHMVYGTIEGLFETDGEKVWNMIENDSVKINISQLFYDKKRGRLLVGTTGKGLFEYDYHAKKLKASSLDSLVAGKDIFYMNLLGDSIYIFGTELGVSFYNYKTNQWYYLNTSNGLSNNEINSSSIYPLDDYLLIGTGNGLNIVQMDQIQKPFQKPKIYISYVKPTPVDDQLILPFRNNFLEINIGILSFATDPLFRTVYKIEGLDENWLPMQSQTIYLRNLSPGDYKLKVKTYWRDPLFTSQTLEFSFSVYKPFWYSIYGLLAGVFILGLIIYGYAQYRTVRLERLSNRLRKELEEEQARSMELENIFTEIFRHSSLGIIFMKSDGEIISSNGTAIELLSGEKPVNPQNIYDYSLFRTNRQIIEAIQLVKMGKMDKSTIDLHIVEPVEKNLRLYFWHLSSREENRIGILISDLSSLIKQKSMEVQIQAYNQILATLAHYLNNTMTILGLAEENYRLNPEEKHARLADIAKMSVKKVKFILDLLDNTINSQTLKFRDYVDAKNLLIDIEEEIKKFNEENST